MKRAKKDVFLTPPMLPDLPPLNAALELPMIFPNMLPSSIVVEFQMLHKIIISATTSPMADPNAPTGGSIAIAALGDSPHVADTVGEPATISQIM